MKLRVIETLIIVLLTDLIDTRYLLVRVSTNARSTPGSKLTKGKLLNIKS